ncbi:hypothetical protein SXCC_01357 [Gluconacetobacter sp. SXCC-1]|nr:hypothetical protein SXCC_01357 [Gluconacetobacter sp. SXCC-1]
MDVVFLKRRRFLKLSEKGFTRKVFTIAVCFRQRRKALPC